MDIYTQQTFEILCVLKTLSLIIAESDLKDWIQAEKHYKLI